MELRYPRPWYIGRFRHFWKTKVDCALNQSTFVPATVQRLTDSGANSQNSTFVLQKSTRHAPRLYLLWGGVGRAIPAQDKVGSSVGRAGWERWQMWIGTKFRKAQVKSKRFGFPAGISHEARRISHGRCTTVRLRSCISLFQNPP